MLGLKEILIIQKVDLAGTQSYSIAELISFSENVPSLS